VTKVPKVFISCTVGNNAFADCLVHRSGDCVELIGITPQMKFNKDEAQELIQQIQKILEEIANGH